jgi:hypothetical protein
MLATLANSCPKQSRIVLQITVNELVASLVLCELQCGLLVAYCVAVPIIHVLGADLPNQTRLGVIPCSIAACVLQIHLSLSPESRCPASHLRTATWGLVANYG